MLYHTNIYHLPSTIKKERLVDSGPWKIVAVLATGRSSGDGWLVTVLEGREE